MDRISQIISVIEKNPGIQFREIMRQTGMQNGVLSYYTRKLEERGSVVVERYPRVTRYYPHGLDKEQSILIRNLRKETARNILLVLLNEQRSTFNGIVEEVKRSPSTVSLNLTQLVQDGIIESKFVDFKRFFEIKNKELVQRTINRYHPDIVEKSVDHLADIFSSL